MEWLLSPAFDHSLTIPLLLSNPPFFYSFRSFCYSEFSSFLHFWLYALFFVCFVVYFAKRKSQGQLFRSASFSLGIILFVWNDAKAFPIHIFNVIGLLVAVLLTYCILRGSKMSARRKIAKDKLSTTYTRTHTYTSITRTQANGKSIACKCAKSMAIICSIEEWKKAIWCSFNGPLSKRWSLEWAKRNEAICAFNAHASNTNLNNNNNNSRSRNHTDGTKKRIGSEVLRTCWHKKATSIPKEFISNNLTMAFKSISKAIGNQPKSFQTFWWVCFFPFDLLVQHHWSALQHTLSLCLHWYSIVYWRLQWIPYIQYTLFIVQKHISRHTGTLMCSRVHVHVHVHCHDNLIVFFVLLIDLNG